MMSQPVDQAELARSTRWTTVPCGILKRVRRNQDAGPADFGLGGSGERQAAQGQEEDYFFADEGTLCVAGRRC